VTRAALLLLALVVASGCAAGRDAGPRRGDGRPRSEARSERKAARDRKAAPVVAVEVVPGWESFPASRAALKRDIDGPGAAAHPKKLASLRAAAAGFDALEQGSLDLAQSSFERAVSLHGSDGYAYLGLAYLHHVQGRSDQAAEFVDSARRSLPPDAAMRKEVGALVASIDANRGGS
jgi:tetratricopeptide (TPR) repeat protein